MTLKNLQDEQLKTLKKMGSALREKREEMGFPIETVAEITRISSTMIRNLESAEYEEFSSLVFIRGFFRNYCKFLEIDCEWMIQELNQIYEENDRNLDVKIRYASEEGPMSEKAKQQNFLYVFILIFAVIIVSGGLGFYFYNFQLFKTFGESESKLMSMRETPPVEEAGANPSQPPDALAQAVERKLELSIEAEKEGWVRVEMDDELSKEAWLKAGFAYHWEALETIRITLGRGDLGKVSLNGEEQTVDPSEGGKLVQMTFDSASK